MKENFLSPETIDRLRILVDRAKQPREAALDVLRAIQEEHGWVSDEGMAVAAEILGLSPLQVEELATFYDKIYRQPVGKRVIHICDSIVCWSFGGEGIAAVLQEKLGIGLGETTADGVFTLLPTCCLGACGEAPAMIVGTTLYGRLTPEKIDAVLEKERRAALSPSSPGNG
jgi:NADH-quinone oxidoreductase subunit E